MKNIKITLKLRLFKKINRNIDLYINLNQKIKYNY